MPVRQGKHLSVVYNRKGIRSAVLDSLWPSAVLHRLLCSKRNNNIPTGVNCTPNILQKKTTKSNTVYPVCECKM